MADEEIDVVNPATGEREATRPRAAVHADGQWHASFHCLVVRPSNRSIVLQERSADKVAFAGKLDLSATGHLAAGETALDGARELEEELGIDLDRTALVPLGTRLIADDQAEGRNRERVNVYLLADDRPLDTYDPAPTEVAAIVEIEVDRFLTLLADEVEAISSRRFAPGAGVSDHQVERTDLVEDADGYWIVVAVMAQRFLDGQRPLAV